MDEIERQELIELLLAVGVFITPIEKRKHWDEYKADAEKRIREAKRRLGIV